ncbi:MAG: UvrD-helicase domain-containing protein, partial [Salibacteraceae bacterium]
MAKKPFIVYKSSAGSGKTFSLAKVFLSIVLENDDSRYFKNILALTFTVKAAAEMKARITSYLSDIASGVNFQLKETPVMIESLI